MWWNRLTPDYSLHRSPVYMEFIQSITKRSSSTSSYTDLPLFTRGFLAIFASPRVQMYTGLVVFAILVVALCALLATLAYLLSLTTSQDTEKRSEYECGFAPFDSATRHPFEVHFYVVGILFLIFDVEIALLFPWVLTVEATGVFSYIMMAQFIYILAIGFHYEWKRGALIWPARYAPSRSTLAHAKWVPLFVLLIASDVPPEILLMVPFIRRRYRRWRKSWSLYTFLFGPEEAGPLHGPHPEWWYGWTPPRPEDPIYGPHLESSCYHDFWVAKEAAEQPFIGPYPRGPHLESSCYSQRVQAYADYYYESLCLPAARAAHRARWWRTTRWRRVAMSISRKDPMYFWIGKSSALGGVIFITTLLFSVALVLTILMFIEYLIITNLEVEKQQFVALWSKVNAYLSAHIPYFSQLPPPARAIPSFLLMVPCALVNTACAKPIQLLFTTLIVARVIFKLFLSRLAGRLRARAYVAEHAQGHAWNEVHLALINRPPTTHPDKGYTDDSDEEHLRTPLFLLALPSAEGYSSTLSTGATHAFDLVTYLLPELTLLTMIVYLLKVIGVELGQGRAKKALAVECLGAAQDGFLLVLNLFVLQLFYTSPSADPVLGGYFLSSWGIILAKFFVAVSSLFVLFASEGYVRHHRRHLLEYPLMLFLAILLLLCLVGVNNLMSLFFAVGGFSITLYVLVLFDVSARVSREAAMKYFYLSTISAGFIIFGTFLLYFSTGTAMFSELRWAFLTTLHLDLSIASAALLFILLGLFFKLSAFPAHLWAVEVYEGSPAPVLAFFLLPVKVAVLVTFARLLNTAFIGLADYWLPCVAIACAGSLLWGAFAALYERKISRFLGYASINQLGYLLMGIACDSDDALRSMYGYLIPYVMMSGGFLFIYMHTRRRGALNMLYISDFRGFAVQERVLSWSLTVFLFSSVGIPPLVGFHAKYIVLVSTMQKELFFLAAVGVGVGLLSAYYYLQFVVSFQFEERNRIVPIRTMLTREGRTAVAFVEACLWVSPALSPQLLPVFAIAADAAVTSGNVT